MTFELYRPKGSLIAAIDIGTAKITCLIAHVVDDSGTSEVIGVGHVASKGVKAGIITDIKSTEMAVKNAVHSAEIMAAKIMNGYPLRDVVMSVPSAYTNSYTASATVSLMDQAVTKEDIKTALETMQNDVLAQHDQTHQIIHTIPTGYKIDGHKGVDNPVDMHAHELGVTAHYVSAQTTALQNLIDCAQSNHLNVDCLCVVPYAAGLASLVDDEKELGALVIDMGAGVTSYAVFFGGKMIHAGAIPIGGSHVTNDLAMGLHTGFDAAERIKTLYGSCEVSLSQSNDMIDIPLLGEEAEDHHDQVPRSTIMNIIRPRVEEIFELIRGEIDVTGMDAFTGGRVVLTGGASQLQGLRDLAGVMLNKQARIGRSAHMGGLPEMASGPEFATTIGLLHYACEHLGEQPGYGDKDSGESVFVRLKNWVKENW